MCRNILLLQIVKKKEKKQLSNGKWYKFSIVKCSKFPPAFIFFVYFYVASCCFFFEAYNFFFYFVSCSAQNYTKIIKLYIKRKIVLKCKIISCWLWIMLLLANEPGIIFAWLVYKRNWKYIHHIFVYEQIIVQSRIKCGKQLFKNIILIYC